MFTTYCLNVIAGNFFGTKKTPSIPEVFYLGLSSTAPNLDGSGVTEPIVSGNGYSRIKIENLSEPINGEVKNVGYIAFNKSTASWGAQSHYVIFDAETGGNLLMYGEFEEAQHVEKGTIILFEDGELKLAVANEDDITDGE